MSDWPLVAVRFALYGDLGLLFGLPFFTLTTRHSEALWRMFRLGRVLVALALVALVMSLLGLALLAAQMSGTSLGQLDLSVVTTLLGQTALGWAFVARVAALTVILGITFWAPAVRARLAVLALCGSMAVASLAWSGHGAADTGGTGLLHLGGDIVHLLAASAWIGALVMLFALVFPHGLIARDRLSMAHDALVGFSRMGTIVVGFIIATGLMNAVFTVGLRGVTALPSSTYGQLLIVKLLLFGGMLFCAVLNRFRLTPALHASLDRSELRPSLAALRRSIAIETALAVFVLALVAWFGMLEPPSA